MSGIEAVTWSECLSGGRRGSSWLLIAQVGAGTREQTSLDCEGCMAPQSQESPWHMSSSGSAVRRWGRARGVGDSSAPDHRLTRRG